MKFFDPNWLPSFWLSKLAVKSINCIAQYNYCIVQYNCESVSYLKIMSSTVSIETSALRNDAMPPNYPTQQAYQELQQAYDHFNTLLFDDKLPSCLITLQRERSSCGYFSAQRFVGVDGRTTDEIAMNPCYFAVVPVLETMQTLVHEMVHLWQSHFGKPGRGRYHNAQWADKMESIGLMPSSTGQPGGQRVGDHMADYAVHGGRFLAACTALLTEKFTISWVDRFPAAEHVQAGIQSYAMQHDTSVGGGCVPAQSIHSMANLLNPPGSADAGAMTAPGQGTLVINKSNRIKYTCACKSSVWGKPGLNILCGVCKETFIDGDLT